MNKVFNLNDLLNKTYNYLVGTKMFPKTNNQGVKEYDLEWTIQLAQDVNILKKLNKTMNPISVGYDSEDLFELEDEMNTACGNVLLPCDYIGNGNDLINLLNGDEFTNDDSLTTYSDDLNYRYDDNPKHYLIFSDGEITKAKDDDYSELTEILLDNVPSCLNDYAKALVSNSLIKK